MLMCCLQLMIFSIPLTLYLARCLDLTTIHYHRDGVESCLTGRLRPIVWLLDHCFFFVLIGFQVMQSFYATCSGRRSGILKSNTLLNNFLSTDHIIVVVVVMTSPSGIAYMGD